MSNHTLFKAFQIIFKDSPTKRALQYATGVVIREYVTEAWFLDYPNKVIKRAFLATAAITLHIQ